ncbi:hypothetical protein BE25_0158 [Staphylococcus phage vB_SepM_BE25]|nr:hypothetical protein BE24_0127 [Staphylococcus phage vB_SepM_BE24]WEU70644.1 hypothetical protein BE25_0158 [Staphylococcus phage vB_SepM_BE25]
MCRSPPCKKILVISLSFVIKPVTLSSKAE